MEFFSLYSTLICQTRKRRGLPSTSSCSANTCRTGISSKFINWHEYFDMTLCNNTILSFTFRLKTSTNWKQKIFEIFTNDAKKGQWHHSIWFDIFPFSNTFLFRFLAPNRITVQMDDDMVKHYSHEDTVLLEVHQIDAETHDITLVEFDGC